MPFAKYSTIFLPTDLEILQKVFDQLCQERRLALKDRDQRGQLANEVIQAFENGSSLTKWSCGGCLRSAPCVDQILERPAFCHLAPQPDSHPDRAEISPITASSASMSFNAAISKGSVLCASVLIP